VQQRSQPVPAAPSAPPAPARVGSSDPALLACGVDPHVLMVDHVARAVAIERNRRSREIHRPAPWVRHDFDTVRITREHTIENPRRRADRIPAPHARQGALQGGRARRGGSSPCTFSTTSNELNDLLQRLLLLAPCPTDGRGRQHCLVPSALDDAGDFARVGRDTKRSHTLASTTRRTTQRMSGSPARDRAACEEGGWSQPRRNDARTGHGGTYKIRAVASSPALSG